MSDAVSTNSLAIADKPLFATTRFGGFSGAALSGVTILACAYLLMTGSTMVTKGALIAALLFNALSLVYSYSYFMRGRRVENRTSSALILFVIAVASAVGVAIVSAKFAHLMIPMMIYAAAYLLASSSFVWDLSDDR